MRTRRLAGAGPATAANDLIWLGVVLRAAKDVLSLPVPIEVANDARVAARRLGLTGPARERNRRPTTAELRALDRHFERYDRRSRIPMRDILWFAIHSARREAEICRIEWRDNDPDTHTGWVRDAKHPRHKRGNDRQFKYTPEAWAIAHRQPRRPGVPYIFPYNPRSVGAAFQRACRMLDIRDLHFHDLRHEATSRLFERGYRIHEVALFTLHESWEQLKLYTHLQPHRVRVLLDTKDAEEEEDVAPESEEERLPRFVAYRPRFAGYRRRSASQVQQEVGCC